MAADLCFGFVLREQRTVSVAHLETHFKETDKGTAVGDPIFGHLLTRQPADASDFSSPLLPLKFDTDDEMLTNIITCRNTWLQIREACSGMSIPQLKAQLWLRYSELVPPTLFFKEESTETLADEDYENILSDENTNLFSSRTEQAAFEYVALKDPIFFVCILALAFGTEPRCAPVISVTRVDCSICTGYYIPSTLNADLQLIDEQ